MTRKKGKQTQGKAMLTKTKKTSGGSELSKSRQKQVEDKMFLAKEKALYKTLNQMKQHENTFVVAV